MLNPAHILEVAFLLLAAFLIGATIGSLARVLVLRATPGINTVAAKSATAPETEGKPALVTAPTIDPIAKPAVAAPPAEVPTPDFSEAVQAIVPPRADTFAPMSEIRMPSVAPLPALEAKKPNSEMAPARVAGQATSGQQVASPIVKQESQPTASEGGASAEVIPFPIERASALADERTTASGDPEAAVLRSGETVQLSPPPEVSVGSEATPAEPVEAATTAIEPSPEATPPNRASEAVAGVVAAAPVPAEPASAGAASSEDDEAAAMRAIEGNWSPRRGAAVRARKAVAPEGIEAADALATAGAAVEAIADAAAPAVIESPVEPPGKPIGIPAPRHGVKDNLTNVIGILPIIETALNSIGVYHFDQIADFTDENVAWLEGHLGIAGRIGREHWREQARELAVVSERARKVAGQP